MPRRSSPGTSTKSSMLRLQDHREILALVGECRDLGDDNLAWHMHFLAGLAKIAGADVSLGGELGGIAAGRPRGIGRDTTTEWGFENGFNRRGWLRALELLMIDPGYSKLLVNYVNRGGLQTGAAMRRSDLVPNREWKHSREYDEVYRTMGVDHNLGCYCAIPGKVDEVIGGYLYRASGRRDFAAREQMIVQEAYAAIAPMMGGPLSRFLEPSPGELPPRVRQVLLCMFEGDGDKQIARRLRISTHTVNQYVKVIFRHFQVQSRSELFSRWIRRGWGARFAWAEN